MKYSVEITINAPRDTVIELFDNPGNLQKWQPTLRSFGPISGEPGRPGAKSRLLYDERNGEVEIVETVEVRNLPDEFSGVYELPGVWNRIVNRFYDEGSQTRWVSETEFRFESWPMRIMATLAPGAFKKQTRELMGNFKRFVESVS